MEPGTRIDRYVVERTLGAGGMATVYAVRHAELGSLHALKVLLVHRPALAERLRAEGRLQASLRHPHIVAVHDVVEHEGNPALVMELVEGMALDEWIEEHWDAEESTRRELARQILGAVGYAHQQGMIHRDLKPANVMITEVAGAPFAKVADFGLAKALDEGGTSMTRTGVPMGTPRYMAPEQMKDAKHVDARADVFALGCLLHELWTGAPAYPAESLPELFLDIASGFHPSLDELPPTVAAAIHGALIPDRETRIPTCEALLEVLEGSREGPIAPGVAPVGPAEGSVAAAPRKRRWGLIAAAGLAILVVLGLFGLVCAGLGGVALVGGSDLPVVVAPMPGPGSTPAPSPRRGPGVAPPPSPSPSPTPSPSPSPIRPSPSPSPSPAPAPAPDKGKDKGKGKPPDNPGKGHGKDK